MGMDKQWRGTVPAATSIMGCCGAKGLLAFNEIGRCLELCAGSRQLDANGLPLQRRPQSQRPYDAPYVLSSAHCRMHFLFRQYEYGL